MRIACFILLCLTASGALGKTECPAGEHWVDPHPRSAYLRYDGVQVRATHVSGHCRTNPRGYKKWHQRLSNSRPKIWGYKNEKSKKWTVEEVQRLYDAISVLPDKLISLEGIQIYRMEKSKFPENPATTNYNEITLYDLAFEHKDSLAQILSHELAHVIFPKLNEDERDQFASGANWTKIKIGDNEIYVPGKDKRFIQQDSRISLEEDFSNHIEEYLFKINKLREFSPKTTLWIENKFGEQFRIKKGDE